MLDSRDNINKTYPSEDDHLDDNSGSISGRTPLHKKSTLIPMSPL